MKEGHFVFYRKDFCVPVTKMEPKESVVFIIDDFIKKGITFCIYEEEENCEIWRLVEENDSQKIIKENEFDKPTHLYVNGEKIDAFTLS